MKNEARIEILASKLELDCCSKRIESYLKNWDSNRIFETNFKLNSSIGKGVITIPFQFIRALALPYIHDSENMESNLSLLSGE